MTARLVPAGAFEMGESDADKFANDTERPRHRVTISRSFLLADFPVTVADFHRFRPDHPDPGEPGWPVVLVSWLEARAYAEWLSRETAQSWRLPGEAEWEYACRAGSSSSFAHGGEITAQDANFLHDENGWRVGVGTRAPAGTFAPNALGLEAMHGNVCEWCADAWHPNYEGAPASESPWIAGGRETHRVIRGGAWDYLPRLLRSSWRDGLSETTRRDNVGFRLACDLP